MSVPGSVVLVGGGPLDAVLAQTREWSLPT
jgi:hypothetical protein